MTDEQSDVSILYWSLGSENGLSDLHEWTPVNVTAVSGKIKEGFSLPDGQPLRLNLLVRTDLVFCFGRGGGGVEGWSYLGKKCSSTVVDKFIMDYDNQALASMSSNIHVQFILSHSSNLNTYMYTV